MNSGFVDYPNRLNKTRRRLNHILNDHEYYMNAGNREFTISMYKAFGKRKITKKMEIAMDNIILRYQKWLKNENRLSRVEQLEKIEDGKYKINLIRTLMAGCGYQPMYIGRSEEFLGSVEAQLVRNGSLSVKQRKALNQMYKRFKKRCESRGITDVRVEESLGPIKETAKVTAWEKTMKKV